MKFNNIDNKNYLKLDYLSRLHQDGNRQSTKQLFSFIAKTNRLGLYVFVFEKNNSHEIYFLPHYILENILKTTLDKGWHSIAVEKIKNHPHSYKWSGTNIAFIKYTEREYNYQQNFFMERRNSSFFGKIESFIMGR